jgi:hypothetical protein
MSRVAGNNMRQLGRIALEVIDNPVRNGLDFHTDGIFFTVSTDILPHGNVF